MRPLLILSLVSVFFCFSFVSFFASPAHGISSRPNVVLITADDLNSWNHYAGNTQAKTPNFDRLFSMGVYFNQSYANAPLCNPSRASFMSSLRPSSTAIYDNEDDWRTVLPESKMLTTAFRNAGYYVYGAGKIYHNGFPRPSEWDNYLGKYAHDCPLVAEEAYIDEKLEFSPLDCDDDEMEDWHIANYGIEQLSQTHDKPLFLALGFRKPHLPFSVPKKYYDMYPIESVMLPETIPDDLVDVPKLGVNMAQPKYHQEVLRRGIWARAIRAYLAAITFVDAQLGRLLDVVENGPLSNDTIVVFLGDHGYHLGEKEHWTKFTLWEEATKAPMSWLVPGMTRPGSVSDRVVEFLGIYPTLLDLCGIPIPDHVEGTSFKSLLMDPDSHWDLPAISTFRFQNHAIRNESWRYIRYQNGGEELYDEKEDPHEWNNLLFNPQGSSSSSSSSSSTSFWSSVSEELRRELPRINQRPLPKSSSSKGGD